MILATIYISGPDKHFHPACLDDASGDERAEARKINAPFGRYLCDICQERI